jgi:hypothetical protein
MKAFPPFKSLKGMNSKGSGKGFGLGGIYIKFKV